MMKSIGICVILLGAGAAASAGEPVEARTGGEEREFTLGLVQREVRTGMSQTDLVSALGSPNIVTRDSQGRESWVYDKVASEAHYKSTGIGAGSLGAVTPGTSLILGLLSGHHRSDTATTTQRTLTVVVRFDATARVESFSFHASRF
jgi:outer membrane protein assembly factor BamE (lipoprotein component of BamABCDE complex)